MAPLTLTLDPSAPIAEIHLTRPLGASTLDELSTAAAQLRDDAAVLVVLLTGEDGALAVPAPAQADATGAAFREIELLPQPVIACIEGDASGIGLELALACDVRVAAEHARFSMPQLSSGVAPSGGGTQRLPRLIGRSKAMEMLLLGTVLDSGAALECGLVNDTVATGSSRARAMELAERIAEQGPIAVRYAKEAIARGLDMPLDQALRFETDLTIILQTTSDRDEGVRAFLEKRKPRFTGE